MIIDISTINFNGGGTGGGAPAKLQTKTVDTTINGRQMVYPDEGYNGMSEVTIITDITGRTSALNFTSLGYDADLCAEINVNLNEPVTYSKTLYDAWNPSNISASKLYKGDTNLIYAPNIDTSNVTSMYQIFDGCSSLTTVPQFDTSNVTSMSFMFNGCSSLTTIPLLDTSNVSDMSVIFQGCSSLTTVPQFDTSNVTSMSSMFNGCSSLTTIPLLDTTNVTSMYQMFYNCSSLTTIPLLDTTNVTSMYEMFRGCSKLESLPLLDFGSVVNINYLFGYSNITTLTTLGGFKNLKINWSDNYGLYRLPNLTYQSVMNVINNLYDFRANGDTTTTRTLKLNANSLALLSDTDKEIATNKGWILS